MKNNSSLEIFEKLKSSKKVLLMLHPGPDGDSLGSCSALKYFLERDFNSDVILISQDKLEGSFSSFEFSKEVQFGKTLRDFNLNDFDLIIFLDHGTLKYYDSLNLRYPEGRILNIDHHITNNFYGDFNYINSERVSTCSILLDLFKEWNIIFDVELSTRLLLGIYTDSGFFSHDDGEAIGDAAFLIKNGADYREGIVDKIKYNVPLKIKKYYGLITSKFEIRKFEGVNVGFTKVEKEEIEELGLNMSEIRGGINYLQEIGGVDLIFILVNIGELIKGSFRSRKNVDVSLIAQELGGGGHRFAAAFKLKGLSLDEAEEKVFWAIKKVGIHRV